MIKFVIVDDDKEMQEKVKQIITKCSFKVDRELIIDTYTKFCSKLEKEIKDHDSQKVYILDIDLEGDISGIDIAEMIRKDDWNSEIIFITNHDKMFETVYRNVLDVFDFIEKFHGFEAKLERDISTIISKNFDNKIFEYKTRSVDLKLYMRNILYIYRDTSDRRLCIVTNNNTFYINLTLLAILKLLDSRFKMTHRACLVNTERVEEYNWAKGSFTLDTGETVSMLSKKHKKDLVE